MKVVFVARGFESLGIGYLSACLKKAGHKTALVFDPALFGIIGQSMNKRLHNIFDYKRHLIRRVIDEQPDLVGFSVVSDDYGWACNIASAIKEKIDIPVIFGGIHPTSVPERVIRESFVDCVCVGEGELAIVELVDALEQGRDVKRIANIWSKTRGNIIKNFPRELIEDLDSLPFPDKDIFYREYDSLIKDTHSIIASRGCPFTCTFCYNSYLREVYKDKKQWSQRRRSVENVIKELKLAKEKYDIKKVLFYDDLFINDLKWLKSFSKRYKQDINLPFLCFVHPSLVNEEVVSCLVEARCAVVQMGIQSIGEALRRDLLARPEGNQAIKRAIELFRKTKIYLTVDIILGLPHQNEEELIEAIKFLNCYKPDSVFIPWLTYYPKTKIVKIAQEEGFLSPKQVEEIEAGKAYNPFSIKGNNFNAQLGKLGNLMLFSPFLPQKWVNWIIEKKLYKHLPSSTEVHRILNSIARHWWGKLFSNKKDALLSRQLLWYLKYYFHYLIKFIFTD